MPQRCATIRCINEAAAGTLYCTHCRRTRSCSKALCRTNREICTFLRWARRGHERGRLPIPLSLRHVQELVLQHGLCFRDCSRNADFRAFLLEFRVAEADVAVPTASSEDATVFHFRKHRKLTKPPVPPAVVARLHVSARTRSALAPPWRSRDVHFSHASEK